MIDDHIKHLARLLKTRREELGLSFRQLENATGIDRSNLHRLESGHIKKPRPDHLGPLSQALNLPLSDLYAIAGLPMPTELPSFSPYLRSKYKDLPSQAQAELDTAFAAIAKKYGYDPSGPHPGEDEI